MLCISMKPGDYFTVGESTVVQLDRLTGDRVHLTVNAPREISILRGAVLERGGGERPACVFEPAARSARQLPWNGAKREALAQMRRTLEGMESTPEVQILREKLELMFPRPPEGGAEDSHLVSTG